MSLAAQLKAKLEAAFAPLHCEVHCESHQHHVPVGSEMHFRVVLVSDSFIATSKIKRHQQVYALLAEEMAGPIHALALHLFTPQEWAGHAPESPPCLGAKKS
ncbi:MAG: BolA/IbaG family iron-sulfur metabolism protein [Gammaproteobacteria bacterium]|nr:BolA/IbaG family iron-sulfur metabolism protein [Gammaproteobacteria bacterium]